MTKICKDCNLEYPKTIEFFSLANSKKSWNSYCRACTAHRARIYYKNNKDIVLTKVKSYGENNKEKILNYRKEYYFENKEKMDRKNNEWARNNPESKRLISRKSIRKARAINAGNVHEDWTEKELFETYGTDCYLCNQPIDFDAPKQGEGSDYSSWPDHVIPTSKGGENTIKNVRPCHKTCNESKGNKTYEEYMLTVNSQEIVTQSL